MVSCLDGSALGVSVGFDACGGSGVVSGRRWRVVPSAQHRLSLSFAECRQSIVCQVASAQHSSARLHSSHGRIGSGGVVSGTLSSRCQYWCRCLWKLWFRIWTALASGAVGSALSDGVAGGAVSSSPLRVPVSAWRRKLRNISRLHSRKCSSNNHSHEAHALRSKSVIASFNRVAPH